MTSVSNCIPDLDESNQRRIIRDLYLADESEVIKSLIACSNLTEEIRENISRSAAELVSQVRKTTTPGMMENFLAEYGLTTQEGVSLMCLAEALLRVPDAETIDELIEDKISHGNWVKHIGHSVSPLVNASTWALMITGKVIAHDDTRNFGKNLKSLVRKLGEPVVRNAVSRAMKELGGHFVLGNTISNASERAKTLEKNGYTYSYDMLGEAARTDADARRYHLAYSDAISRLAKHCKHQNIQMNPGISVKFSALHARYEFAQKDRVMEELVPRAESLVMLACSANMGFNIDAEEADRLDLSLEIIERLLSNPALKSWDGFGVVVQAFSKRASAVIEWLYELAERLDRKIMVRLVKGAYWDTEIKRAQVLGLEDYPVFTRKVNTDVSFLTCAKQLLSMTDRIYPQFATHNAHSVSAIIEMADDYSQFEFQRLHGMGEALHETVKQRYETRCRIYAPVGENQDLLAYLVRRLLENGANSSFVNQIVDESISPEMIAADPFETVLSNPDFIRHSRIPLPKNLYGSARVNSKGWDITDYSEVKKMQEARDQYRATEWRAEPFHQLNSDLNELDSVINPANPDDTVGHYRNATIAEAQESIVRANEAISDWSSTSAAHRANILREIANLYEQNLFELMALLSREAGKTWLDAIGEIREAVDFARYYASQIELSPESSQALGVFVCISPWNFPLAIFSGQIFAALAAGNTVIAKPAEQTPLIASVAIQFMHKAGVPEQVIQYLPGRGAEVGSYLTGDERIAGVCFTGSTQTAGHINKSMARHLPPDTPLIAETGGLNAMMVDSTALPEQVVRDVIASAFQSTGQRCSALRMLYIQDDIADHLLEMLYGAMDDLSIGDSWNLQTDIGPIIDKASVDKINAHCESMQIQGRLRKQGARPERGLFVPPTVIEVDGIEDLESEIFGPVLHVARFQASDIEKVVDNINAKGYGLTFGLHSRVDQRVESIVKKIRVGNIYVNRNQIGAVVGTQPFGGEGLSGTGPKAGGPEYIKRFLRSPVICDTQVSEINLTVSQVQPLIDSLKPYQGKGFEKRSNELAAFLAKNNDFNSESQNEDRLEMPGPTGERNQLSKHPRGVLLCLGPSLESALKQAINALAFGNSVVIVCTGAENLRLKLEPLKIPFAYVEGNLDPDCLTELWGIDGVLSYADSPTLSKIRIALANRSGAILPMINEISSSRLSNERHVCVDTTAAGGNASLIADSS
ncbi:MAG: RHH-type proline utilization regulon transcriptional repressor/proline dehydrogenase [Gammaproteobacteria bacterium]|jgi:RHH-type proline utilization regulon transcriptional repressor/proline dehydrogenase/delta 1-pyrroline-5-carboxylate dehydrogenase